MHIYNIVSLSFLFTITCGGIFSPITSDAADKLLYSSDMVYQGAFRVPSGVYGCNTESECSFHYGGTAIAYNTVNNSLFMVGHDWNQKVAEISIPKVVNSSNINNLAIAKIKQPFVDITEGHLNEILADKGHFSGSLKIGGLMVSDSKLVGTVYAYYDGACVQTLSHFTSSTKLTLAGDFAGMFQVGSKPSTPQAGFVSGYMTRIPSNWQSQFGGPALTGNAALGIVSRTSLGPSAFVFNPDDLGKVAPVPATAVVYYPITHPTLGKWDDTNPYFNGATEIKGMVFPSGSRSVLFFGRHGAGEFCYGPGTNDKKLAESSATQGGKDKYCYDPAYTSKGTHSYPYLYQVWAYDADDLLKVKNGNKQPWNIKPYAVWNFELPFQKESRSVLGAAYDPATQRIFISQLYGEGDLPVVHVFRLSLSPATEKN